MSIDHVTVVPVVPNRTVDNETEYREHVDAYHAAIPGLSTDLNTFADQANEMSDDLNALAEGVTEAAESVEDLYALIVASDLGDLTGNSTTSNAATMGAKTFTATPGKKWRPTLWVDIRSASDPTVFMAGPVTAYDTTDGNPLIIDVRATDGSGATKTDWVISATFPPTPAAKLVSATKTDTASTSSSSWADTGLQLSITLDDAAQRVKLDAVAMASVAGGSGSLAEFRLVRSATPVLQGDAAGSRDQVHMALTVGSSTQVDTVALSAVDAPGSTGPHTYKLQWKLAAGSTIYLNRDISDGNSAGVPRGASTLTALQVGAA